MKNLVPQLFLSLKTYSKKKFVNDLIAGIIVAIIALPLSIALALASGVSPEQGLYTAIIAGFLVSALGGSRVQIAGPTAAFATIVAGIVAEKGMSGLASATIIAGILLVIMGVLRLGNLVKYIPYTITVGFTAGIAVTIVIGQIKDFFGLTFQHSPIETIDKMKEVGANFHTLNVWALAVGALALAILIIWPKFIKKIPASLIAVIVTASVVKLCALPVNTIGDLYTISSALPQFHLPDFSLGTVTAVLPNAFTIAILAAIESLLSCVVADEMIGSRHNSNMELIGQGAANAASALFGGIPATGAIARTAANIKNGGTSPVAGMVHAVVLLVVLVFCMPYAALIPMPCIAAILFQVAYNMSGWRTVVKTVKCAPRSDAAVLLVTFILTVFFDLVIAIFAGLLLACVLFIVRTAKDTCAKEVCQKEVNNAGEASCSVLVYEMTGPLFFGSADKLPTLDSEEGKKAIVLQMRAVSSLDITALNSLRRLWQDCKKKDMQLIFSGVNEQPLAVMKKSAFFEEVGAEHFIDCVDDAMLAVCTMKRHAAE